MATEVKFRITDPGIFWSLQTIEKLGGYSLSAPRIEEIDDVYLDTKKRKLQAAGYYCRQRDQAKGVLVTLKKLGSNNESSKKPDKWHILLKKKKSGPDDWPKSEARTQVLKIVTDKKLRTVFTLHQTRITRLLSKKDRGIALATLDDVSMVENSKDQQFKILKIKLLIQGGEDHLKAIIAKLQNKWALKLEPLTKFERALTIERSEKK